EDPMLRPGVREFKERGTFMRFSAFIVAASASDWLKANHCVDPAYTNELSVGLRSRILFTPVTSLLIWGYIFHRISMYGPTTPILAKKTIDLYLSHYRTSLKRLSSRHYRRRTNEKKTVLYIA
ncbi:hypothetical protein PV325_002774, partial [Microctonus aethiopoides]